MGLTIEERKRELIERYGPWTAHNIRLGGETYTIGPRVAFDEIRLRQVIRVISDFTRTPFDQLRVLDLGCLEGLFAVELALRGADVVGIEGREMNVAKARFAQEVLSLKRLRFEQDDVRNLSAAKYGVFDIVLCLGLLYHLDAPDIFPFLRSLNEVCSRFAIIETHLSLKPKAVITDGNTTCRGSWFREHDQSSTAGQKAKAAWSSLDNPRSFWLTRASLLNALSRAGFTSVYECDVPHVRGIGTGRLTLIAVKGSSTSILSSPAINLAREEDWPEAPERSGMPDVRLPMMALLRKLLPASLRKRLRAILVR